MSHFTPESLEDRFPPSVLLADVMRDTTIKLFNEYISSVDLRSASPDLVRGATQHPFACINYKEIHPISLVGADAIAVNYVNSNLDYQRSDLWSTEGFLFRDGSPYVVEEDLDALDEYANKSGTPNWYAVVACAEMRPTAVNYDLYELAREGKIGDGDPLNVLRSLGLAHEIGDGGSAEVIGLLGKISINRADMHIALHDF